MPTNSQIFRTEYKYSSLILIDDKGNHNSGIAHAKTAKKKENNRELKSKLETLRIFFAAGKKPLIYICYIGG